MSVRYKEGTWFAVPLSPNGYATGVVARISKGRKIFLGYFFGPRQVEIPSLEECTEKMFPSDAVAIWRVGDLGIFEGSWAVIGVAPSWNRSDWPFPQFIRKKLLVSRAWSVTYAGNDANVVVDEKAVPYDTEGLDTDAVWGCGAAEDILSELLP